MTRVTAQYNFDPRSLEELKRAVGDLARLCEIVVHLAGYLQDEKSSLPQQIPCHTCPKEGTCKESCDRLKTFLGGDYLGRGRRENLTGLFPNTLQEIERIRQQDIFKQYESWKGDFTKYQWLVVELFYNYGLSEERIGKMLGKSRSTINGLLNRAKRIKEEREKRLRLETRNQLRKKEEDEEK